MLVMVAPAAAARGAVSEWEFKHVYPGDTKHQVDSVWDTKGRVTNKFYDSDGVRHKRVRYPTVYGEGTKVVTRYTQQTKDDHWLLHDKLWCTRDFTTLWTCLSRPLG